jgi:hypothetical protein
VLPQLDVARIGRMPRAGNAGYGKPLVTPGHPTQKRQRIILTGGFLALCAAALLLAGRHLEAPGVFYDEVIQAEPALQFLRADGRPSEIPGIKSARLWGRWFPVMTQPYMGALKSQALIPTFALFGATPSSLRLTTLVWGLAGLLLAMLWARRTLGLATALLAGAFVALDPSFLLVSRHDWGSVALAFICRCGFLYFAYSGWSTRRGGQLFIAGLLLGLGLYNKIDFGIFLGAAGVALLVSAPAAVRAALHAPRAVLGVLGFVLGAAPMAPALGEAVRASRTVLARRGGAATDWSEKLHTLQAVFDGSYFHRLMIAGGDFEEMFDVQGAATGPFPLIFVACVLFVAARLWARRRRSDGDDTAARAQAFVLVTTLLSLMGFLLMPAAERIHHVMNAWPFPQLTVAIAVVELWQAGAAPARRRVVLRGAAIAITGAVLAGGLVISLQTLETMRQTGGKGRWSDALGRFAVEEARRPGSVVVSLDWGLDGPLRFAAPELETVEPIWKLQRSGKRGEGWFYEGEPEHVYLLYVDEFALFDFGASLLEAVASLPPGSATIRTHLDRSGDPTFLSVRIAQPHRLVYRRGFEVRLR